MAIASRWPALGRARFALPVAALLFVLFVPSHYVSGYSTPLFGKGRPVADMVSRLQPYRDLLSGPDTRLLARHPLEGCNYLSPANPCTGAQIGLTGPGGVTPATWLDRHGIDYVYADEEMLAKGSTAKALDELQRQGWQRIAPADPGSAGWLLLGRQPGPETAPPT